MPSEREHIRRVKLSQNNCHSIQNLYDTKVLAII